MLMYHAVSDDIDTSQAAWSVRPDAFEAQMRLLHDEGWNTLTMSELCSFWEQGNEPPPRSVAVAFDDGYDCLFDIALPIMQRYDVSSTMFVISGYLGDSSTYDKAFGVRPRAVMSAWQVRAMHAAGHEIGSHTVSHPDLRTLTPEQLRYELVHSCAGLEDLISAPVRAFSYPHGFYNRRVHDAVAQVGYRCAVSVECGMNTSETARYQLRRANIGAHTTLAAFRVILRYGGSPAGVVKAALRRQAIRVTATLRGSDPMDLYRRPVREWVR
jgi:peptidoglycan/xylan/chitin deacetylase (PgdA/CDA1 family)